MGAWESLYKESEMNEEQINEMIGRFLAWPLPKHFSPDCGINFDRSVRKMLDGNVEQIDRFDAGQGWWPVGTNLFDAEQTKAMILHMIGEYEEDLSKCPQCGGEADNGHDRCLPASAYMCSKCCAQEVLDREKEMSKLAHSNTKTMEEIELVNHGFYRMPKPKPVLPPQCDAKTPPKWYRPKGGRCPYQALWASPDGKKFCKIHAMKHIS